MYEYLEVNTVKSSEHMLYASEIARKYCVYTVNKNAPHSILIKAILEDYALQNRIVIRPLFYQTAQGLAKVYPKSLYKPAMEAFFKKVSILEEKHTITLGRAVYSFRL